MNDESSQPAPAETQTQRFGTTERPVNVVVHRTPPTGWRRRLPGLLRAVEFGAILAFIAVAVPVVTFWYQSAYLPTTLPAGLTVTATLTELKQGPAFSGFDDLTSFEAAIHIKNAGSRRVTVLAATYSVWGIHLDRREDGAYDEDMAEEQARCGNPFGGRYLSQSAASPTLLATGRFLDGSWFDAGQDAEEHPLFFVPPSQFDVAHLEVFVYVAKGDLVKQVEREPIDWSPTELVGAKESCGFDLAGDMTVEPLHWTSWDVKSLTPVVGELFSGDRRISVEWRPVAFLGERLSGSACDLDDLEQPIDDPCWPKLTVGATGRGTWVEPMISYCASGDGPESCELAWTMPLSRQLDLEQELGLAASSASASVVLWPGASPSPPPLPSAPIP